MDDQWPGAGDCNLAGGPWPWCDDTLVLGSRSLIWGPLIFFGDLSVISILAGVLGRPLTLGAWQVADRHIFVGSCCT